MANVVITDKIKSSATAASLDAKYGPYASTPAANAALGEAGDDVITAGLTVGITQSDGSIKEYWYQPDGQGGLELVEKQAASVNVDAEPTSGSTNPVSSDGVYNALQNKADTSDIPTVPTISTDISADAASDTKTASPKAVKTFVEGKGYLTQHQDISGKVDKVSGATPNNFASFDSNGGLQDSNCNEGTFIKGVKKGTETLTPVDGVVTVPSDIEGAQATSVPSNQSATANIDSNHILQLNIPRGADAVNPFKGWLTSTNDLPNNPHVGDYAYVEDSGTTYVYRCTTEGTWPTTSTEEKEPSDATFASAQLLNNVKIDDTHLEDINDQDPDNNPTLPKAVDVAKLNKDVKDIEVDIYGGEKIIENDNIIDTTGLEKKHGSFQEDKMYYSNSQVDGYLIPLASYKETSNKIKIKAKDEKPSRITFLKEEITFNQNTLVSNSQLASNMIVDGAKVGRLEIAAGTSQTFDITSDANYLYVYAKSSTGGIDEFFPTKILFLSVEEKESIIPIVEDSFESNSKKNALSVAKGKELNGFVDTINKELYPSEKTKEEEITGIISSYYIDSNNNWLPSGKTDYSELILVNPGDIIVVNSESGNQYGIGAVLKEESVFDNNNPSLIFSDEEGFDGRFSIIEKGEVITNEPVYITMPSDAHWFYHSKKSSSGILDNRVSKIIKYNSDGVIFGLEKLHADVYGETIYLNKEEFEIGNESNGGINPNGWIFSGNAGGMKHKIIDCSERSYEFIHIIPNDGEKNNVSFLLKDIGNDLSEDRDVEYLIENGYILNTQSLFVITTEKDIKIQDGTQYIILSRIIPTPNHTTVYKYPEDIYGIDIYKGQGVATTGDDTYYDKGEIVSNIADNIGNHLITFDKPVDDNGYEIPSTLQQLILVKKIRQFANIKWTPLHDIRSESDSFFSEGTEYTGIPYSSVKELDKFIGKDVSIETFMTAINNPYSLIYTEDVSATYNTSIWGFTYHGDNCNEYYGMVCSEFTSLLTGFNTDYATAIHAWMCKYGHKIVKLYLQTPDALEIGDIIWRSGHTLIVYGLKRDENGKITHVCLAEAAWPRIRINGFETYDYFMNNRILNPNSPHIIYRSLNLYKNVDYEASPFVKADNNEEEPSYQYNNDICTFAGNKPSFIASNVGKEDGDLIVINYNLDGNHGNWSAIELYKNDELIGTYQLSSIIQSELPEGQRNHARSFGNSLTYGMYKARMTDGNNNYSEYTEFEVIDTNVEYSFDGDFVDINFSSANAKAVAFKIATQAGGAIVQRELTDDEIRNGHLHTNVVRFYNERYDASEMQADIKNIDTLCIKVYFQGKFGRVTNKTEMIENPWK